MAKRIPAILLFLLICSSPVFSQVKRPKLVVGIVVDQMRWDYLYRYQQRYSADGFKRMLREGFSCENTLIPYTPTVTAAGHTCIYTGSVPAIHGVAGNAWYDRSLKRMMYCSESVSDTVKGVGSEGTNGKMSPANMLVTTVTDELRLATNKQSKVIGVCIKDRGSIFPAGHMANAAYWYDGRSGNWITSTFYMKELPEWVKAINAKKPADAYYKKNWNTLYPINTYTGSTEDEKPYEGKMPGAANTSFPHDLSSYIGKSYDVIASTPYGNTMTLDMAKAALDAYQLGKGNVTDFLAVSLSSPDYVGHRFGPNSIEAEDTYLRLDLDLADFMKYLDQKVGKGNYTLFLTADHGVAHVPGFLLENRVPAGNWQNDTLSRAINNILKNKYNVDKLVVAEANYQVYINYELVTQNNLDRWAIEEEVIRYCMGIKGVANAFRVANLNTEVIAQTVKDMMNNGYNKRRSGDIQIVLEPGWIDGYSTGTTHGLWNPYDAHIPMVWMGWGIKQGASNRTMHMTDIAPTVAALLHIQMPSGNIGQVMTEVLK